jgi:hypothetical protein
VFSSFSANIQHIYCTAYVQDGILIVADISDDVNTNALVLPTLLELARSVVFALLVLLFSVVFPNFLDLLTFPIFLDFPMFLAFLALIASLASPDSFSSL